MRNTWLSFAIPSNFIDELYNICESIYDQIKFKPMRENELHMTAIFLGKQIKTPDIDIISDIIRDMVNDGKFEGQCKFEKLSYFPPNKKNLIVAEYSCPDQIKQDLLELKEILRIKLNYNITDEEFIPHVTLGKLMLTKKELCEIHKSGLLDSININKAELTFDIHKVFPIEMCNPKHHFYTIKKVF